MHYPCANVSCIEGGHFCFTIAISIAGAKVASIRKRHLKMSAMKWNICLVIWLQAPDLAQGWVSVKISPSSSLPRLQLPWKGPGHESHEELQEAEGFLHCLPFPSLVGVAKLSEGFEQNCSEVAGEHLNPLCSLCWDKAVVIWKWPNRFLSRFGFNKVISLLTGRF